MAQWLKPLAVPAEDLGSASNTHMAVHSCIWRPLLAALDIADTCTHKTTNKEKENKGVLSLAGAQSVLEGGRPVRSLNKCAVTRGDYRKWSGGLVYRAEVGNHSVFTEGC